MAMNAFSLPIDDNDDDDEEGTLVSDNPNIKGEDEQIDDPKKMFNDDLYDGDMDLTKTQQQEYANPVLMRSGNIIKKYKWPKSVDGQRVIVRYVIRENSPYSKRKIEK